MKRINFVVDEQCAGQRLDTLVALRCDNLSRSAAAKLIEQGEVVLCGRQAQKRSAVKPGDTVTVNIPQPVPDKALPQDIPLDVVFEDEHIIVVNKPKGMVVHPAAGNPDGTLVNALLHRCDGSLSGIGGVMRPGIVHRLDKDTSGLIVAAKTDSAHAALADALKDHDVKRIYHAVTIGNIKQDSGTVNAPIARDKNNRLRMAVMPDGRQAVTHFEVLARYKGHCYVMCQLETGRTHQIRVHMKHLGHPLAGDTVYGQRENPLLAGQCLHAKHLSFAHPITGETMTFESELPQYFSQFLRKLERL